ncbi:MAG: neutral/alkaline non-lysosomal ceramidase N-terminal domain-containing protein [Kiritimatiellae bacterium]|nr:neutral/alkaline non-lysosomal ceramidase N-terminal domain-containing protein [Kiritimatiellia bacterium]
MARKLKAGAACADITPADSQFLFGYPHVKRYSTGVHDRLNSTALCLDDGAERILFVSNDIAYVPKDMTARARRRISKSTGIAENAIMLTATHTHSGPVILSRGPGNYDDVVPNADPAYLKLMEDGIVAAAEAAVAALRPAEIGLVVARVEGIGTNRRDPSGPADPEVPVLMVRDSATRKPMGVMTVYAMHPTVMHEDSTLVSADFPGMARAYLQEHVFGAGFPVLHHTGASGNQSPRYCVRGQTFAEAERLGAILGRAVEQAVAGMVFRSDIKLGHRQMSFDYPVRDLPSVADAAAKEQSVREKFARQQQDGTPRAVVRTTECDLFGAEATHALARSKANGALAAALTSCMPAEMQLLRVGPWNFLGWQGEVFIEYALEVRRRNPDTFVITCANGSVSGYVVTEEAAREGGYEASTSVFSTDSGRLLVQHSQELLDSSAN